MYLQPDLWFWMVFTFIPRKESVWLWLWLTLMSKPSHWTPIVLQGGIVQDIATWGSRDQVWMSMSVRHGWVKGRSRQPWRVGRAQRMVGNPIAKHDACRCDGTFVKATIAVGTTARRWSRVWLHHTFDHWPLLRGLGTTWDVTTSWWWP